MGGTDCFSETFDDPGSLSMAETFPTVEEMWTLANIGKVNCRVSLGRSKNVGHAVVLERGQVPESRG